MLQNISYKELCRWTEYYTLEPFGEWRSDVRSAQVCQTLANLKRDPKQKPDPWSIEDFLLKFEANAAANDGAKRQSTQLDDRIGSDPDATPVDAEDAEHIEALDDRDDDDGDEPVEGAKIHASTIAWLFAKAAESSRKQGAKPSV